MNNITVSKSNERFFQELFPLIFPKKSKKRKKFIQKFLAKGLLDIPSMLEAAISRVGNLERVAGPRRDFIDGSDAKKTTVRWRSNRSAYSAPVSKIHNKIGVLRVMCYNGQLDTFYYFLIPREAYAHIDRTSNIEIPFMKDGTPQRGPVRLSCNVIENWWEYEVKSFEELSKPMPGCDVTKQDLNKTTFGTIFEDKQNVSSSLS